MSYKFQMLFSGLCAFVPNTDIDDVNAQPTEMDVLLVNTDHVDRKHLKFPHEEDHFALLRYDLGDTTGGLSAADTSGSNRHSKGMWTLSEEHLTIEFRKRTAAGVVPSQPKPFVLGDITALPRIDKIFPLANALHPEALGNDPDRLKARFRLTQGTLHQDTIGQYQKVDIIVQFVPPPPGGPPVSQTLATKIALTVELDDDEEVVIHSQPFSPVFTPADPDVRHVVLNPKPGDVVEVSVMNLCCGYYMEKREDFEEVPAQDVDFEFFYLLARDFGSFVDHAQFPIPFPIVYQSAPVVGLGESGGDTARCNMVIFNPKGGI